MLAMHGWQDNAASFDRLAPLIADNVPVLAIDLPGHGISSWLPPGSMYTELVYLLLIKRIKRHFGWERMKVLAHSLSSMTTYWYAAMFPSEMQYVVALDYFRFPAFDTTWYLDYFGDAVNALVKQEESNSSQHSYSESEILQKLLDADFTRLDEAACRILMTRSVTRNKDGTCSLNRDPRIRVIPIHSMFSREQLEKFAERITCPYLVLKAEDHYTIENNYFNTLDIMRVHNNDVHFKEMPGMHHFHLTHAETAVDVIRQFLERYDSS